MENQRETMLSCAAMLEKYDSAVRKLSIYNQTTQLQEDDLKIWQQEYFPTLVEGGVVEDYQFFGDTKNLGIGNDGIFQKSEYCHFMYRLYKRLASDIPDSNYIVRYIRKCAAMLEPFVEPFRRNVYKDQKSTLNGNDMTRWQTDYYLYLSGSGLIEDGGFFHESGRSGMGNNGIFVAVELLHFLYRLYQYIVKMPANLPVWKTMVFHCIHTKGGDITCDALSGDAAYVSQNAERYAKFMFAFSGGKVLFDTTVHQVTRSVALSKDGDNKYWLDCMDIKEELNKYTPSKTFDVIFGVSRYGKIPVGNWGGLTTGIHPYANEAGYCVTRFFDNHRDEEYLIPSLQNPPKHIPYPEEFMVHEAIHVLECFYTPKYGTIPNPDQANVYGYNGLNPGGLVGGFYKFYADILSGKVKDPSSGNLLGVKTDMWKYKPSNVQGEISSDATAMPRFL